MGRQRRSETFRHFKSSAEGLDGPSNSILPNFIGEPVLAEHTISQHTPPSRHWHSMVR